MKTFLNYFEFDLLSFYKSKNIYKYYYYLKKTPKNFFNIIYYIFKFSLKYYLNILTSD